MANIFYNNTKGEILKGNLDLLNDTIKLAFMDPSFTPNADTQSFYSDISASTASGSTDQTLTGVSITVDNANDRAVFDANNVSVANETITGGTDKVVLYKDTGTPATSALICSLDITEGTLKPIDGTLALNFNASGIFAL